MDILIYTIFVCFLFVPAACEASEGRSVAAARGTIKSDGQLNIINRITFLFLNVFFSP